MRLQEKPSPAFKAHLDAIQSREVTKGNIIGIRTERRTVLLNKRTSKRRG